MKSLNQATFLRSISSSSINDLNWQILPEIQQEIITNIERNKIMLLGEIHGVKENTDIIYKIFKEFKFQNLALEWRYDLQKTVQEFLTRGTLNFNLIKDSADGRITAGHFNLLKLLSKENLLENLILFEPGDDSLDWNERDKLMAQNIIKNSNNKKTLVVAGNLHTKLNIVEFEDDPYTYIPMGSHIKNRISDTILLEINYLNGRFFNYGLRNFSIKEGKKFNNIQKVNQHEFRLDFINAHEAITPNTTARI